MSGSITVGTAASTIAALNGFDFSSVDWGAVRQFLIDSGLYTSEVGSVIDQFERGNFSSLYTGVDYINTLASIYPPNTPLDQAANDYNLHHNVDVASSLPDTAPPSEMNWGESWRNLTDQIQSFDIRFDGIANTWRSVVNTVTEWAQDDLKPFIIGKAVGAFESQAEEFLNELGDKFGVKRLYDQINDAKELYDKVTNFHTNMMNNISDAIDGNLSVDEFDKKVNDNLLHFVDDLTGTSSKVKSALDSVGSGIVDWVVEEDGGNDNLRFLPSGAKADAGETFALAFAPLQGAFRGTEHRDGLIGGSLADKLMGLGGNDILDGLGGNDTINGGNGNDKLLGAAGKDILVAGNGNDLLKGGVGGDSLYGGAGSDVFYFAQLNESTLSGAGRDIVFDFRRAQHDHVDLHRIDANTKSGGNQAFHFIGNHAFRHHAGELQSRFVGHDTLVSGDVNGDGHADFGLTIRGHVTLLARDFVL